MSALSADPRVSWATKVVAELAAGNRVPGSNGTDADADSYEAGYLLRLVAALLDAIYDHEVTP